MTTNSRKAYEEKFEAQMKEWSAQIALFKAREDKARAESKIATIHALQDRHDGAGAKLKELKAAGDEAWDDLKTGAEKSWDEVKGAFHVAASRFK